jgi:hypothetical protein
MSMMAVPYGKHTYEHHGFLPGWHNTMNQTMQKIGGRHQQLSVNDGITEYRTMRSILPEIGGHYEKRWPMSEVIRYDAIQQTLP